MKKIILSIILILALVLSLAACDLGGKEKDENDDDAAKYDDSINENINYLVNSINQGLDLEALLNAGNDVTVNDEQIDIEALVSQARGVAAQMILSLSAKDSEAKLYMGTVDGAYCAIFESPDDKEGSWMFLEDDMKIVTVNQDEYGCYGEVVGDLSEYFSMMDSSVTESNPYVEEIMTMLEGITFPEITKKDVSFKDGKYYVSDNYLVKIFEVAFDAYLEAYLEYSFDMEGEYYDDYNDYEEEYQQYFEEIKSMAKAYIKGVGLELYFYMENETVTGLGIAAKPGRAKALELFGYETVEFLFDVNGANMEIKAVMGSEDELLMDCYASSNVEFDVDGNFKSYTFVTDCALPYSDYSYLTDGEEAMISGVQKLHAGFTVDAENLVNGSGEWMNIECSYEVTDVSVSIWDEDEYNYVFNQEYTNVRAKLVPVINFSIAYAANTIKAHVDVKEDGETVVVDLTGDATFSGNILTGDMTLVINAVGQEVTVDVEMAGDLATAHDFPEIPEAVQTAREEAISEYDYYY